MLSQYLQAVVFSACKVLLACFFPKPAVSSSCSAWFADLVRGHLRLLAPIAQPRGIHPSLKTNPRRPLKRRSVMTGPCCTSRWPKWLRREVLCGAAQRSWGPLADSSKPPPPLGGQPAEGCPSWPFRVLVAPINDAMSSAFYPDHLTVRKSLRPSRSCNLVIQCQLYPESAE
jgi:hypothetical protein